MTCREFTMTIEGLTLAELSSPSNAEMLAHQHDCASCAALLQQESALAGAVQALRSRTATMEAPPRVEQRVLRAFRQAATAQPMPAFAVKPQTAGFRLNDLFGWRAYAAVAAVLAIALSLGLWFARHSSNTAQPPTARTEQPVQPSVNQLEEQQQLPVQASASNANESNTNKVKIEPAIVESPQPSTAATLTVAQSQQVQGYTPLMLCDPISCSGEAEVVRMELPTTAADGSTGTQMADVIVGDDGLVRAIRIVQQ